MFSIKLCLNACLCLVAVRSAHLHNKKRYSILSASVSMVSAQHTGDPVLCCAVLRSPRGVTTGHVALTSHGGRAKHALLQRGTVPWSPAPCYWHCTSHPTRMGGYTDRNSSSQYRIVYLIVHIRCI